MKFLSDILAKAGLTVDGVVTLNNTATGQTPDANDNSTKLATTAWVRTFVQPYSLPIASSSVLGGIKVGNGLSIDAATGVLTATGGGGGNLNFRTIQEFTATAGQTTFTISGGYTVGYIEVLINGVYISESQYTATNGTTIVLDDAAVTGDLVTVFLYSLYNLGESTYARNVDTLTATAGQTSFTTSYIPGQIDVYYNGSKLTAAEYTATTGSSIVLAQAAVSGDIIEVVTYLAGAGINANRTLTINGTTYDLTANRTWTLTTANISEVTNLYYTDARVATYLTTNSYATQSYVGTQLANLVASAPSTLDTLNELASALGNDPSFATTVATSIGTKVPQTRTITINGTAYDLSADRSWTIASGVTSFNTRTGAITAASGDYTTAQVTESGNLYYTDTRVRAAISLTTTGTSGAATYDSATGIFNIPQYQGGVTSFNTRTGAITLSSSDVTTALTYTPVTNARTITINGTSYDLSANRSWTIAPDVSVRTTYAFTATAAQTTFTVSGGYTVGLVDVFINGVKLAAADFTATNGTTVVLGTGTGVGNIVEIVKYVSAFTTAVETTRTLTINGTTYDLSANRTWSIDNASLGAQAQLNGTGLVRMSGTTVSYDNATYATQSYVTTAVANLVNSAPSTLDTLNELATALGNDANFATTITTSIGTKLALTGGTLTGPLLGTSASFSSSIEGLGLRATGSSAFGSTGVGVEIGYNGELGYVQSYNRSTSTWQPIKVDGSTVSLQISGVEKLGIASTGAAVFSSTIQSNDPYGFTVGSMSGYRRIEYGTSAATSFAFLTNANGYANIHAGSATFSSTVQSIGQTVYSATLGYVSTSYQAYAGATTWYVGAGNSGVSIQPFVIGKNLNGNSPVITINSSTDNVTFSTSIQARTALIANAYTPYTYNDQFEIQNETAWRLRFQAYHYGSGYSYRIVQNNNGADINVMTFINGNITISQAATFNSSINATNYVASSTEALRIQNDNGYISFYNSSNTSRQGYLQIQATALTLSAEGSSAFMAFATGGGSERVRITETGRFGIGTSGPATYTEINRLFATGSTQEDYLRLTASQGGAWFSRIGIQFRWNDFGNGAAFNMATIIASPSWNGTTTGGGDLVFSTKSYASPLSLEPTEKMRIYANGAVTKGAQPFAMGGLASNQSISNTTFTPLAFQTNQGFYGFNTNNCWNNSTYTFTAPVGGVYIVNVSLLTDCIGQVALFVNGTRKHSIPSGPFTGSVTWGGSAMIPLSAGEALTLQGYGIGGTVTSNIYHTFFSIYLLG